MGRLRWAVKGQGPGDAHRSLARLITVEQVTCWSAVVVVVAAYTWLDRSAHLLVLAAALGMATGLMGLGRRALVGGDAGRAVAWVTVAIWTISVVGPAIATFCLPITVVGAMLPSALAVSYVSTRTLWRINIASMSVSMLAVVLGTMQDFTGVTASLPAWVPPAVLVFFVPFSTGLHVMVSGHNSERLSTALRDALAANRRLRASEEDLRTSRCRIVAVADEERRRIARDLHDGAQARLLGLAFELSRARRLVGDDPCAARACLDGLAADLGRSMHELRDLAHGVHPAVLRDRGLAEAMTELSVRAACPCSVDVAPMDRCSPEVEAAVYWCCVEALQNVAKHAGPQATARVRVRRSGDEIRFSIEDDGRGFAPGAVVRGRGLANMADRIGAIGGDVVVTSAPGRGVRVCGRVYAVSVVASEPGEWREHLDAGGDEEMHAASAITSSQPSETARFRVDQAMRALTTSR